MASRYSAARPRRAGEAFARQHHGEDGDGSGDERGGGSGSGAAKKVTFDVRNPSALAPDAREEDDVLEADVIGVGSAATKRGAVNIDGYDSDSENETFNARAEQRKRPGKKAGKGGPSGGEDGAEDVNLLDQLDNYDKRLKGEAGGGEEDGDDDDMFAGDDDDDEEGGKDAAQKAGQSGAAGKAAGRKKWKEVRFLADRNIEGQEETSKSGGHIHLDEESSSDEEDAALAIQEEAVDEEVGAGGLKKHAPKIDAFNMREEQEEGAFDESGNFIRKAVDPDAQHDRWLDGLSKKEMRRAAEAHDKREADLRQLRREDDSVITADLFATLITRLERGETALEALARLGKHATQAKKPKTKRIPKWRLKQMEKKNGNGNGPENGNDETEDGHADEADQMDVDKKAQPKAPEDPEQTRLRANIDDITEAADRLLNRDYPDIYDTARERLVREYRAETGEAWVDPPKPTEDDDDDAGGGKTDGSSTKMWEYRWIDGRDGGAKQGPYDGPTMKAWQDAGYFDGVEFRPAGGDGSWSQAASFV